MANVARRNSTRARPSLRTACFVRMEALASATDHLSMGSQMRCANAYRDGPDRPATPLWTTVQASIVSTAARALRYGTSSTATVPLDLQGLSARYPHFVMDQKKNTGLDQVKSLLKPSSVRQRRMRTWNLPRNNVGLRWEVHLQMRRWMDR